MIWFRKIRSVFVHVKKKEEEEVFGIEKLDLCLLNKTKSIGFKKKYIYIYIYSDVCCDKKILILFRKIKSIFVHVKK